MIFETRDGIAAELRSKSRAELLELRASRQQVATFDRLGFEVHPLNHIERETAQIAADMVSVVIDEKPTEEYEQLSREITDIDAAINKAIRDRMRASTEQIFFIDQELFDLRGQREDAIDKLPFAENPRLANPFYLAAYNIREDVGAVINWTRAKVRSFKGGSNG